MGGNAYAIPIGKMEPVLRAIRQGKPTKYAVGRCLLTFDGTGITVERENRKGAKGEHAPFQYLSSFDAPVDRALEGIFADIGRNTD